MSTPAKLAYGGYEYQIVVSVWLALDLIVARSSCEAIDIEPASQEDVAAELQVNPDSASSTVSLVSEPGPIEIQIKKHSRPWTLADVKTLIKTPGKRGRRGRNPRLRAFDRLTADPRLRYVLVTSAQVNADARHFVVQRIGSRSDGSASDAVPAGDAALRRVGILEQQVPGLVEHEIEALLELCARVPLQRVAACRVALVETVRLRLLGRRPSRLDRAELNDVVMAHGGILSPEDDNFVAPASFNDLALRLEQPPFALILVGPPGIGKTAAAQKLVDDHRRVPRPFDVLKDPSVGQVRAAIARAGRTLFYLEDPWGRYRRTDEGDVWTDELPRLIRGASGNPDKRFIVTSRTGILADSISLNAAANLERASRQLGAYVAKLQEADFDAKRRLEILRRRMRGADRWQRDWIDDIATDVVARLTVPQALATFAQQLRSLPRGIQPDLDKLISQSQVDAIAGIVARQMRELGALESTVVLWIFVGTTEPLTPAFAREVSAALQSHAHLTIDVPRLVSHLEANGWIAVRDNHLAAHPTVIEGLEQVVDAEPVATDRTIRALLSWFVARGDVVRATRIAGRLQERALAIPPLVRTAIEDHLRSQVLTADDSEFLKAVEMLTRVSTAREPVSLVARAVAATARRQGFPSWTPPAWTDAENDIVRASPDAETFARRWIRLGLRQQRFLVNEEALVRFLGSLGWDLTEDLTAAAIDAMDHGATSEIALRGALAAPDPSFDRLLDAALRSFDEVARWFEGEGHLEQLRAEEGELDAGYSAHVIDEPGEQFYVPSKALELIVRARRALHGFRWLSEHSRRDVLIEAWAAAIPFDAGDGVSEELLALLAATEGSDRSYALTAIGRARCVSLTPTILQMLAIGAPGETTCAWTALFGFYAPDEVAQIVEPVLRELPWARRAAAIFAANRADIPDRGDHIYREPKSHRSAVLSLLSSVERGAFDACLTGQGNDMEFAALDEASVTALVEVTEAPNDLLASLAVLALATTGYPPSQGFGRLGASSEKWARLHILRAVRATVPLHRAFIRRGFSDPYYQCRRFAMSVLAARASANERAAILSMSADRSAPVREACAAIIGQQRWPEGLTTLCDLLSDRRDRDQAAVMTDAIPDYHVARAAARALREFAAPLPREIFERVLHFVERGPRSTDDLTVHGTLVSVLAQHRDDSLPPLIERLLRSGRRAGGPSGTFPLRYAAAWSWFDHLSNYPDDATAVPPTVLAKYATHTDERLAAPTLLALGIIANHARSDIERILADSGTTPERALLLECGSRLGTGPHVGELLSKMLAPSHPGRRLFSWCLDTTLDTESWRARLDTDEEVQGWLKDLRVRNPVHAALRAVLLLTPRSSLLSDISAEDLRSGELPTRTPMITSFYFAGLE